MKREIFEKLQKYVFDKGNPWDIWLDEAVKRPNRLPYFSTWAIWNDSNLKDVTLINSDNAYRLNPGIVFVALNFSGHLVSDWPDWYNIHGVRKMYKLLRGTRYEGAYITDFIKNYPGLKSEAVMDEIENNKGRRDKNIGWFFEEMDLLGADTIEMFLLGGDVAYLFDKYVKKHPGFDKLCQKVKKCLWIDHYSGKNRHFERNAPTQLGLASNPEATIHKPLWEDLNQNTGKKHPSVILLKGGKPWR
jgi:hypothetical protein